VVQIVLIVEVNVKGANSIDFQYLSELEHKIQTLSPEEASPLLLEASTILLFAGFPELAYQGFLKLTQGELEVSEASSLVHPIKAIIPALCYLMRLPCPAVFSEQAMSFDELEKYIKSKLREFEGVSGIDRWFHLEMPSGNWDEAFLYDLTHPKVDIEGEDRFKVRRFLQELHRVISQFYINHRKWQAACKWLKVFEEVIDTWKIDCSSYVEQEILVFGIRTYFHLGDTISADGFIQRWWQSLEDLRSGLYLLAYLPNFMQRISEGTLRNRINLSQEQVQALLDSIDKRSYISAGIGFVLTVDDWNRFLEKWNEAIFNNLDEEHIDNYSSQYLDVLESQSCFRKGATEEEISELENRLKAKLPLGYRNFLLASNGFTILNEYCELYGIDQ
jgi:hypothetical protein